MGTTFTGRGATFNGGTITTPLEVESDTQNQLVVRGVGVRAVVAITDDLGTSNASIDSGGAITANGGSVGLNTADGLTPLMALTSLGLYLVVHAAPADGDLSAGDCYLWFDQTNGVGNTKLMVKGKSADGTVKTASIVLA